jgi:putative ABC transport system substrate-binding protein
MQFDRLRRRELIALIGGAAAWPLSARAQQAKIPRIGFLRHGPASANADRVEALRAGLRQLGYIEGQNITIEFRWAESVDQLPGLVAELLRMNVDLIFAMSSTEVEPTRQATKTIPIVFATNADPLASATWRASRGPAGTSRG